MASLLALLASPSKSDDPETPRPKKKIPKVAVYVSGAAFAVTLGLTALVLPFARQAYRLSIPKSSPIQFLASNHVDLPFRSTLSSPSPSPSPSGTQARPSNYSTRPPRHDPSPKEVRLGRVRLFNTLEERSLHGYSLADAPPTPRTLSDDDSPDIQVEPQDPLMGIKALALATALVFGSAGLGVLIVAKALGVNDMEGFNAKMREGVGTRLPGMTESIHGRDRVGSGSRESDGVGMESGRRQTGDGDLVGGVLDRLFAALEEEDE